MPPGQPPQDTVFRSGASLVALNVTVHGRHSDSCQACIQADFAIYEDGVQQHVQFFESHEVPVDLIVLIDTSSSMSRQDRRRPRGGDRLPANASRSAIAARWSRFGDKVQHRPAVDRRSRACSNRPCGSAGRMARPRSTMRSTSRMKQFGRAAQQAGEVRRQAIAVLSDGEDTSSVVELRRCAGAWRARAGMNIYTICLQNRYSVARVEQRPEVTLGIGLRDEDAGPGNRRAVLLPGSRCRS